MYFIAAKIAAGTSIADKLPALKLKSVGSSSPISSVDIIAGVKPRSEAAIPNFLEVVLLPHSWEVPPTKTTGAFGV